ncbi:MAG TPA: 3-hydroxyacyl-CoA dehydrogenase NAD-binding domain-containing protein, partial [Pirellulaceae bacterium]|nr:3-hydroxyacyl-CoA dehydrogenase NAD-binding domain-containing protein [Pirellulaceae bacterium]
MVLTIESVGVVGCGLMGSGIVQISAVAGFPVTVVEADAGALEKGLGRIQGSLKKLTEKGVLTADAATAAFGRITKSGSVADLKDRDLIVEAIVEDLSVKKKLFETLGKVAKPTAIL